MIVINYDCAFDTGQRASGEARASGAPRHARIIFWAAFAH
jgi:hypothetical protein